MNVRIFLNYLEQVWNLSFALWGWKAFQACFTIKGQNIWDNLIHILELPSLQQSFNFSCNETFSVAFDVPGNIFIITNKKVWRRLPFFLFFFSLFHLAFAKKKPPAFIGTLEVLSQAWWATFSLYNVVNQIRLN